MSKEALEKIGTELPDPIVRCCGFDLEFKVRKTQEWRTFRRETATCPCCSSFYQKKIGKENAYKQTEEGLVCSIDGTKIEHANVAHPIHNGIFAHTGSGRTQGEKVPYCPECEEEPLSPGIAIRTDPNDPRYLD